MVYVGWIYFYVLPYAKHCKTNNDARGAKTTPGIISCALNYYYGKDLKVKVICTFRTFNSKSNNLKVMKTKL